MSETELRTVTIALRGGQRHASTTHSQVKDEELAGVTQDTVRLSLGIEPIDDILGDVNQARAKATARLAV